MNVEGFISKSPYLFTMQQLFLFLIKKTKMFRIKIFLVSLSILFLLFSCSTPKYFHDPLSKNRQVELKNKRSGNTFANIGLVISSAIVGDVTGVDIDYLPEGQEFKKLKIINPTKDTLFINMLTDVFWDEENYCDFMDIRIPPGKKCKVLVPVDANYNLYFSNTLESDDDEMLEINTSQTKNLSLIPGLTKAIDN